MNPIRSGSAAAADCATVSPITPRHANVNLRSIFPSLNEPARSQRGCDFLTGIFYKKPKIFVMVSFFQEFVQCGLPPMCPYKNTPDRPLRIWGVSNFRTPGLVGPQCLILQLLRRLRL